MGLICLFKQSSLLDVACRLAQNGIASLETAQERVRSWLVEVGLVRAEHAHATSSQHGIQVELSAPAGAISSESVLAVAIQSSASGHGRLYNRMQVDSGS